MLNEIRRIFRKSIEAFRAEANLHAPEDQIAELLGAMRRELVAAKAAIPEFEEDAARFRAELAREREGLAQCERRGAMAEKIGDADTVRVAGQFAARHREKIAVLEQRVAAADAQLALHRREADEMLQRYKEADANRFALLAQLRASGAKQRMSGVSPDGSDPMDDFSRMEERIQSDVFQVDAMEELDESPPPPPSRPSASELDERLKELKRKMGQE